MKTTWNTGRPFIHTDGSKNTQIIHAVCFESAVYFWDETRGIGGMFAFINSAHKLDTEEYLQRLVMARYDTYNYTGISCRDARAKIAEYIESKRSKTTTTLLEITEEEYALILALRRIVKAM